MKDVRRLIYDTVNTNSWMSFSLYLLTVFLVSSVYVGIKLSAIFVIALILFALPGLPLAFVWCGGISMSNPFSAVFGLSLGVIISSFINSSIVRAIGWNIPLTLFSVLLATGFGLFYAKTRYRKSHIAAECLKLDPLDYLFLLGIGLVVVVILAIPLSRVGHISGSAHLYHSLFSHDYLARGAFASAVLHGIPVEKIFLAGYDSNSYFLVYSFLAFVRKAVDLKLRPDLVIMAADFWFSALFLIALLLFSKAFLENRKSRYLTVTCGMLAYSFNGLYTFVKRIVAANISWLRVALEDRGLLNFSDISHGWYRDMLMEPQAVLALVFFICLITLLATLKFREIRTGLAFAIGLLLAGITASDSSIGLICVIWFGFMVIWNLVAVQGKTRVKTLWIGLRCFSAAFFLFLISIEVGLLSVSSSSAGLQIKPYRVFWVSGPGFFITDYGPLFIFSLLGAWALLSKRVSYNQNRSIHALFILAAVCIFFIAFVQHGSYEIHAIARKSGKLLQLPLIIFSGLFFQMLIIKNRQGGWFKWFLGSLAVAVLGFTTLAVDLSAFSGFYDAGETSRISKDDFQACSWLRANTPLRAIAQGLPEYTEGYYAVSPIAFIGGKRMALGNLKMAGAFFSSKNKFEEIKRDIYSLFEKTSHQRTIDILEKYAIDYIYVGPHERDWSSGGCEKYYKDQNHFKSVYSEMGVDIFQYCKNRTTSTKGSY